MHMESMLVLSGKIESRLLRLVFDKQWVIGACPASEPGPPSRIAEWSLLEPPTGTHYADPFIVYVDGEAYIFFETWNDANSKGSIWVSVLDSHGGWGCPEVVLERPYHVSYPFVFEWNRDFYMLPETRHNHTIELYRSIKFPTRWESCAVLMDRVDAVDTTLFEEDGVWWMFTAGLNGRDSTVRELSIFHAESPFGPWAPHPRNPVVVGLRGARPAGRLFRYDGQLIRPGQDCRRRYGHAIVWNRVDVLDRSDYHETCIGRLTPRFLDGWLAMHTFNQAAGWVVLDGSRLVRRADLKRAS